MSKLFRATVISVAIFGASAMVTAGTPGLAIQPDDDRLPVTTVLSPARQPVLQNPTATAASREAMTQDQAAEQTDPDDGVQQVAADDDIDDDFATLTAAVAAQAVPSEMDGELNCLAVGVYFEAKGEPLSGQLAVAEVILNRAASRRFPHSVCSVLKQPRQFSFVRGGRLPSVNTSSRAWRTAVAVAQVARDDHWENPVPGALFFHARYVSPGWRLARVGAVGNHIFYR